GGAVKVTKGFLEKFGERRGGETPMAEAGFTGLAAGAALYGPRPGGGDQFADGISGGFHPNVNGLAPHPYQTAHPLPTTLPAPVRAPDPPTRRASSRTSHTYPG